MQKQTYALPYEERFEEEELYAVDWNEILAEDVPFSIAYSDNEVALYRGYEFTVSEYTTMLFAGNEDEGTDTYISMFGREDIVLKNITAKELTGLLENITTNPRRLTKHEIDMRINKGPRKTLDNIIEDK